MKQLMADEFLQIPLAFAQCALWKHDSCGPREGRISFFRSGGFDQLNGWRQRKRQIAKERLNGLDGSLHRLHLVFRPIDNISSDKLQEFSFRNRLIGFQPCGAIERTQTLDELILRDKYLPALALRREMHRRIAELKIG